MTGRTLLLQVQIQFLDHAEDCLFEADADRRVNIRPLMGTALGGGSAEAAKAPKAAEEISEDISKVHTGEIKSAGSVALESSHTELIVLAAFVRIREDGISL